MKKRLVWLAAMVFGLVCASAAFAESEGIFSDLGITVSGDAAYYSEYLWRGMLLDGDAVLQPGVYVAGPTTPFGKLTAKLWSSHDLENRDSRKSEEYDYILDYTFDLTDVSLSAGHTYYDFPETDTFSREFYAGAAFPKMPLSPSVFIYRDYGEPEDGGGAGTYTVASAAYSVPITVAKYACSLDISGHYGYNHELFINGKGSDIGLAAAFSVPLAKNVTLAPSVNYSAALGDLEKESDGNQKDRLFAGLTLKFSL
ncbi:MAG: hypothetical protein PHT59_04905 [Candidatus Omnitrophica bacterium]|nr:hypothetical protein [Candidatus Omnitrophota bacterium]